MINVYAPQETVKKRLLWNENLNYMYHHTCPFIIFGDFNVVRDQSERLGSMFCLTSANDLNRFIIDGDLVIVPLGGYSFTRVSRQGNKLSKLDRFLVSEEVLDKFSSIYTEAFATVVSDHRPIILKTDMHDFGHILLNFLTHGWRWKDFMKLWYRIGMGWRIPKSIICKVI